MAEFTNFATLLAFAAVNASALKLFGKRDPYSRFRHFSFDIVLPALGLVVSLWLAANAGLRAALFGGALLGTGILVDLVTKSVSRRSKVTRHD